MQSLELRLFKPNFVGWWFVRQRWNPPSVLFSISAIWTSLCNWLSLYHTQIVSAPLSNTTSQAEPSLTIGFERKMWEEKSASRNIKNYIQKVSDFDTSLHTNVTEAGFGISTKQQRRKCIRKVAKTWYVSKVHNHVQHVRTANSSIQKKTKAKISSMDGPEPIKPCRETPQASLASGTYSQCALASICQQITAHDNWAGGIAFFFGRQQ